MKKKLLLLYPREGSFAGLDSLEWLKLEDNAISALSGGDLFPASLKVTCQQLVLWKEVKYSRSKWCSRVAAILLINQYLSKITNCFFFRGLRFTTTHGSVTAGCSSFPGIFKCRLNFFKPGSNLARFSFSNIGTTFFFSNMGLFCFKGGFNWLQSQELKNLCVFNLFDSRFLSLSIIISKSFPDDNRIQPSSNFDFDTYQSLLEYGQLDSGHRSSNTDVKIVWD